MVQGVGFRPTVYRLAVQLGLKGEVFNDGEGVVVILEGKRVKEFKNLFLSNLPPLAQIIEMEEEWIPARNYHSFQITTSRDWAEGKGGREGGKWEKYGREKGRVSSKLEFKSTLFSALSTPSTPSVPTPATLSTPSAPSTPPIIPPDLDLCPDCLQEMENPQNRRYLYPFINCTNCGPRWTILKRLPYDRPNTSMEQFTLCSQCLQEYNDPADRRFHAQPIGCYQCGPTLSLYQQIAQNGEKKWRRLTPSQLPPSLFYPSIGREEHSPPQISLQYITNPVSNHSTNSISPTSLSGKITDNLPIEERFSHLKLISFTARQILEGKIVAIKGVGGFHLICDATNRQAVTRLRKGKNRPFKPLALMFQSVEQLNQWATPTPFQLKLLTSQVKPIVLVKKKVELPGIADGIDHYGVFLPYTPLHFLLFKFLLGPVVATSANISEEPIIISTNEVMERLGGFVDLVLTHNRPIVNRCDDSVIKEVGRDKIIIRAGRGLTPHTLLVNPPTPSIPPAIGVGAHQKNRIALLREQQIITSPHIGDLETVKTYQSFQETIARFHSLFGKSKVVIADLHPHYYSTKWARQWSRKTGNKLIQVQHHYAHLLAVLAEYRLTGDFLGFGFDGTGYGPDGTIWGGEILLFNHHSYQRLYHLKQFKLIGGEKGIKNPANSALALLPEELGKGLKGYSLARKLLSAPFPVTSSMGRLFDIVAYLGGLIDFNRYDGYAGMVMEQLYDPTNSDFIRLSRRKGIIDFFPLVEMALRYQTNPRQVATLFLNSISQMVVEIGKEVELPIVLGGGVFQNQILVELILTHSSQPVYLNRLIPPNDGGIPVGQLYYYLHNWEKGI